MTENDFDRTARTWLQEGPGQLSDRVLQAALDEIHITRQRRPWWPARRFRSMGTAFRLAASATAIVVAAAVGIYLLPGGSPSGPQPTAPPSTSPDPLASASAALQPQGSLAPGDYSLSYTPEDPVQVRLSVPDGWVGGDYLIAKNSGDQEMAVVLWGTVANVYRDGCQWRGSLFEPPVGPTVEDLADALAGLTDRETTAPIDITIDGFAGKEVQMTIPEIEFGSCDEREFRTWVGYDGGARFHQGPGEHSRIWILDVNGERILLFSRDFPSTSAEDRAELDQIMDSIRIETPT